MRRRHFVSSPFPTVLLRNPVIPNEPRDSGARAPKRKLALWRPGPRQAGLVAPRATTRWPCGAPVQLYRPCVPPAYFDLALWHPSSLLQMALWPPRTCPNGLGGHKANSGWFAGTHRRPRRAQRQPATRRRSGMSGTCPPDIPEIPPYAGATGRSCRARPGWCRWRSARNRRPWTSSAGPGSRRPALPGRP
jgi:hypothetical protein